MASLLPTLFLSHGGGPCFYMTGGLFKAVDSQSPAADFFRNLQTILALPSRPTSLVVVSAHWEGEQDEILIQASAKPPLLFDYYGFPPEAYQLTWPAPGAPALAQQVRTLLTAAGFRAALDTERGYDHGVFVPLKLAFPSADIPTLQVSLHASLDVAQHLALGRALAPLRSAGALIIGSGFATHNLREISGGDSSSHPAPWAQEFDGWLARTLLGAPRALATAEPGAAPTRGQPMPHHALCAALERAQQDAPHFARAHPRTEHLLPLFVALGAAAPAEGEVQVGAAGGAQEGQVTATEIFSQLIMGTASLSSWRFD